MAFDFKKEYKALYQPKREPALIEVPKMQFLAVRGKGDPNEPDGDYSHALQMLYTAAYTLKMSKLTDHRIAGYFDYTVPPLEGLWQQAGGGAIDYSRKADFEWISLIRLPDFVAAEDIAWAKAEALRKKKLDCGKVEHLIYHEGLCVQCMHLGSYDSEPETMARMTAFLAENGLCEDHSETRRHHEIYLSDPRKTAPEKLKTVIRMPVRRET